MPAQALCLAVGVLSASCAQEAAPPEQSSVPVMDAPAVASSALVGVDGDLTVSAPNTQLNQYAVLGAAASAGATSFVVDDIGNLASPEFGALAAGDLLMIIQMQGATIGTDTTSAAFGTVTALNGAGLYELVTVGSISGNTITISTAGCSGLRNGYVAGAGTQVVRVPQLARLTINATASVVARPWDGTKGGVVALQVQNAMTVNGLLSASAAGFRGGEVDNNAITGVVAYASTSSNDGGEKGESIAGYKATYDALGGRYARGAAANGGGGGNAHNAGGGGGANGSNGNTWSGQGVMSGSVTGAEAWTLDPAYAENGSALTNSSGGGRGGYTFSANDFDARTYAPGEGGWNGDYRRPVGGLGGRPVTNDPATRLFLGGGGGAGDGNNAAAGPGGNGGGIVWVVADVVTGSGTITSNGQNGGNTTSPPHNDSAGGAGAGGTVVVAARSLTGVSLFAQGGKGGDQLIQVTEAEGPGGGGGGGYIATSGGTVPRDVSGGVSGITQSPALAEFPVNGATYGATGQLGAAVAALPLCLPSDLAITVTDERTTVEQGQSLTYTITVTNNGPNAVSGAAVTDAFPAALTGVSWTCAPASSCSVPSGTGNLADVLLSLPSGGSAVFTVTGTVSPTATGTLTNTATVASPASNVDPVPANNSATDTTTIVAASTADLQVSIGDSPDPVVVGGALTYTVNVTNNGPSTASSVTATVNLPPGTVFVGATGTGWTCSEAGGVVTCTRPSLGTGEAAPPITVQVTAPSTPGSITATSTVSTATTDPVAGNNSASQSTTVVGANSPPVANDDAISVGVNSGATVVPVLNNDTDPNPADTLTVTAVTQPTNGTVTLVNGVVSYTPNPGFIGTDTFTYTISDGNGGTDTATVTVTIINNPPTANDDAVTVPANSTGTVVDVLGNDTTAPDTGETLTVTAVTQPTSGTVTLVNGVVTYTPNPGFIGTDTFTYTISDGNGGTDTATVTVTVALNNPPDGKEDSYEVYPGGDPIELPVLDNDTDPDPGDTLTVIEVTQPGNGKVTLENGKVRYQPDPGFTGTDTFTYTVSDGKGGTDVVTVTVTVGFGDDIRVVGRGCASSGSGTLVPLALMLLALPLLRRRSFQGLMRMGGLLGVLAAMFVSAPALAQDSQSIDVQQYKPGPGSRDVLGLHSAQIAPHLGWNLGLSINYARNPLNFLRPSTDEFIYNLVRHQYTLDLMGSISLFDRIELGVAVPLTLQKEQSSDRFSPLLSEAIDTTGLGDLRVVPKVRLLSTDGGLHLALVVPVILPTSGGNEFRGREGVAAFPRLVGEWSSEKGTRIIANAGVNFQPRETFRNLSVGNEFAYGLGAEVPFHISDHKLAAEATIAGALGLKDADTEERPLEVLGALKYFFSEQLTAHVGAGPGLTRGYGTPAFRILAGVNWTAKPEEKPVPVDSDGDGLMDPDDRCPNEPEDKDGFQDEDGCPDPDNDQDGIPDVSDKCPNEPETMNGFEDADGCPDAVPDSDGDGLTDDKDRCPNQPEDKDGFQDEDGCPDPDNDKDGIPDTSDECINEPEVINGVMDEDGCPDKGEVNVRVEGKKFFILQKVHFATNKDVILERSFSLLKQVAAVLRANPQLTKIRVEGHTDSQGSDAFNMDLSDRRAKSVRTYLIEKEGIAADRLEAVGYGETQPVDTNATAAGRENNRRVIFTILEQSGE
ncbi:conserved repeat domain-containing protein [Stigmatella aurantiaca]|uniref:Conserved repeat domain-containing protein n=1 Tax=Stigmatella aurantiaca TaxID=41 RepID=A0A1H7LA87_STIAU|nr:Ig-like domain-containing protein [Stigmatella aurantiaca]SEK95277.1 conserved repeat domain-containing protein [Stigmatella aurantiaca]